MTPSTPEEIAHQAIKRFEFTGLIQMSTWAEIEKEVAKAIREDRAKDPCPTVLAVAEATKDLCPRCRKVIRFAVENS